MSDVKIPEGFQEVKGVKFEQNNYTVEIKYSQEAVEKELIRIIPKDGEIVISADDIIKLIVDNFRNKELAYALSTTDTNFVPSVEVAIPIHFNANRDIKQGDLVSFYAPFILPIGLALGMEAYQLCKDEGRDVLQIPRKEFEESAKTLKEKSMKFVEEYFKPQIDAVKKELEKAADTGKAVN